MTMRVRELALVAAVIITTPTIAAEMNAKQKMETMCGRWVAAAKAKDLNAQLALYTDDVVRVAPEGYEVGKGDLKKAFEQMYQNTRDNNCIVERTNEGSELEWGSGTWEMTINADKGPQKLSGHWVTAFKGQWPNAQAYLETWNVKPQQPGTN